MALLISSSRRPSKTFALSFVALLLAAGGSEAQTYYWNPGPATAGTEVQKSTNWTLGQNGSGIYPASSKDDDFADTTMGPWTYIDSVKDGNSRVSFTSNPGRLTLAARGVDVWTTTNQFAAIYRTDIQGNFDVSVKVVSRDSTDPWSKVGILVFNDFNNPAAGGAFSVEATPGNGYVEHYDALAPQGYMDSPNGPTSPMVTYPHWLRVTRVGTAFTAWYRTDSTGAWIKIRDSRTPLATASNSHIGLFVTAHTTGATCTAVFDDFHGGGDVASTSLDLNFGGTGSLADNNAILGSDFAAKSINFTNYSGAFSFGGWNLSLTGNATFSPTMAINPNTGRLTLAGTTGTQSLVPKVNDTLPVIWKTGGSNAVILANPLIADSLHFDAGSFDLGSLNAHLSGFSSLGGTLTGMPAADDTLFLYGKSDFSGLTTLTPGLGVVMIKAVGNNKTVEFNPGGKGFRNVSLWTVPTGVNDATIKMARGIS